MLKPSSCIPCSLYNISNGWIESEGEGSNGVVIMGESGGYNEYVDGLPFRPHAQAGSKLEEVFRLVAKDTGQPCTRKQFLMYNVVNCNPPRDLLAGMSYEQDAIHNCSKNVDKVVGGFHTPFNKTILALGNIPLKFLTGVSGVADEKQSVTHLRGFVFESRYGLVVPSIHPSFIRRGNGALTPLLVEDMKKALAVARGMYKNYPTHKEYIPPTYQVRPSLDEAWSFYYLVKDSPRLPLTYDIETQETAAADEDDRDELGSTDIILIQFSIRMGMGIALPWTAEYMPVILALFDLENNKANHNTWNFDNPILKNKGVKIRGKVHDTMWMFKHWHPKLPRGLQNVASLLGFPFPWKHLYGANLNWYGCADVDAVQWILHYLPRLMKERGIWEGYKNHVYRINPIMERASEHGVPVNEEKRLEVQKDFKERRDEVHKELQKVIPDEVRDIEPKRKEWECPECKEWIISTKKQCERCRYIRVEVKKGDKWAERIRFDFGYKREPKEVGELYREYNTRIEGLLRSGKRVVPFEQFLYRRTNLAYAEFAQLDEVTGTRTTFERWAKIENFDGSSQQLIRYLNWKRDQIEGEIEGLRKKRDNSPRSESKEITREINVLKDLYDDYEVPQNLKTKKDTTGKKEIEEMFFKTGDPVLEMVMQVRSYETNLNNYIPNWKPKSDGRVHPTYGYTAPQGQINSWRPNSQNVSKHTEFGNEFRGMIEAPKGYVFLEADKKSFHVGTMGYCANDKDYIRFSQIDPHSILGSYIDPSVIGGSISLKWSDADIKEAAKEFKKRCKLHKLKDPAHNIDVRQELAKPTVLGNQLELGAKKLQRQNRRFIHSIAEAERLQRIVSDLFPKVEIFKKQIKEKAHLEKFLINEYGRIQYFYDVFQFSKKKNTGQWVRKEGEGARQPVAFRVQGTAFGMITDELWELEVEEICEEHNFIVTIHDSFMFMPEKNKEDKCAEAVNRIMNMPAKVLCNEATGPEGLIIGVELSVGRNWKGYHRHSSECLPNCGKENLEGMQEIKV